MELGSGMASKTRALLYAMAGNGSLRRYVPFDVDESVVEACAVELVELYPGLRVHGVVGDFGRDLEQIPSGRRRLFAFLGGTIGNLFPDQRAAFLARLRELMGPDDRLVIGTDLVKDRAVLEAAYNDSAGVTAEFNRNVLRVVNAGLGADFDPEAFEHVAFFDEANSWIEMRLRANGAQTVRIDGADLEVVFADGEEMRTEISAKFTREAVERELDGAGLRLDDFFTDGSAPVRPGLRVAARLGHLERQGPARHRRRLDDRGGRLAVGREAVDQLLHALHVAHPGAHDVAVVAGDAMALDHLGRALGQLRDLLQLARGGPDAQHHAERVADRGGVELGPVAADHAALLQPGQALRHRRRRQPHAAAELRVREPGIGL